MVAFERFSAAWDPTAWMLLLAEQSQKPPILQMQGATRAKVLAALAALVILGLALMALTWLGARMTRRYMNHGQDTRVAGKTDLHKDAWAKKPLNEHDDTASDQTKQYE